jgi:hypothetical protein
MSRWKKEYDENGYEIHTGRERADTKGKTENFFSRNVKLITFLCCIAVFLLIFGPIAVLEARDYLTRDYDTRPQMTLNDAIMLSDQNGNIRATQVEKFAGEKKVNPDGFYYYIDIEPHYQLLAVADKNTGMLIYCQIANLDTGETVDVLKEDVRAFLN